MILNYYNKMLAASSEEVDYYVLRCKSGTDLRFGIKAELLGGEKDFSVTEPIFFTFEEAEKCCKFLADNAVYPISLADALHNIYFF